MSQAGSLTPPGAPAPTMKTLAEVEPRTPISSIPITISEFGSYYLTGNLTGLPGTNGITIISDSVTIDLNGFALIGVPGSTRGIEIPLIPTAVRIGNVSIRNGTVRDWGLDGIYCPTASNSLIQAVRVAYNGADGLWVGRGCRIADSVFTRNTGIGMRHLTLP